MWQCLECGRKFRTVKAAEKAANNGCPKCGGVDVDDVPEESGSQLPEEPPKPPPIDPPPAHGPGSDRY
jgi:predicted  nucleic acid-binding Zn-ribbon protein